MSKYLSNLFNSIKTFIPSNSQKVIPTVTAVPTNVQSSQEKSYKPLGRWSHEGNEETKIIRAMYASSDHCGDPICGKPETTKSVIEK